MSTWFEHPEVARMRAAATPFADAVPAHDLAHTFDRDAFAALGAAGLYIYDDLTNQVAGLYGAVLGARDLGLGASICAHLCGVHALARFGGPEHADVLGSWRRGDACVSVANSEPGRGTDLLSMTTRATETSDGWTLRGLKGYVTNVGEAEHHLVSARVEGRSRSLSVFLVDEDAPGADSTRTTDLLGLRTSTTGCLEMTGAPSRGLVGEVGQGLDVFRLQFDLERLLTGVLYVAATTMALERALAHLRSKADSGHDLTSHQYVQDKLVRARVSRDLHASHVWMMADAMGRGEDVRGSLSATKLAGLPDARRSVRELQSLLGGAGLREGEPLAKIGRDLHALTMLGGAPELHKIVTYRELSKR